MSQVTRCDSNDSNLLNFGTFPRPHCILQVSCAILRKHQMSNSRKKIELFYDVVSPYTWLAFEVLCRYRKVWNVELKLRPAYLGGVMLGSGNSSPASVLNKRRYMTKDLNRLAAYMNVPLRHPSDVFEVMFKKGSLTAMHFITAVAEKEKDSDRLVENVSRELWKRIWSTDQDICEPVSLSEAGLNAGLSSIEVEELLSLAQSQPIKDKLMQTTQEALDYKAFGFPLIVCHGDGKPQVYFGSDRFELIAHCIGEKWLGPQPDKPTSHL
ncbi:hypothetical protein KOW79_000240 [Hemibagrus wyckioides]|uniref:Glutathione S-transferase kappa 1 n=2 Tax=Hemibagrus wyckioides TaxID=337641 RepID=A0A9D3P6N6_9TELE|nr:hypothetical protein KOW79_000240 [Hemibagrus wyckioides]